MVHSAGEMACNQKHKIQVNFKERKVTFHPSGLRSNNKNEVPVSKSVHLNVPSDDDVYSTPSFPKLNLKETNNNYIIFPFSETNK